MVKIVETVASSVTSTKQHIWRMGERCEERDDSGNPSRQFFSPGQINGSTNYFYCKDHLGSVRTLTDDNADVQAVYSFDPFGRAKRLEGAQESDFQFAGYYLHTRSSLNLTVARAYNTDLGRFINRDPIAEVAGPNLFAYVDNDPLNLIDPFGEIGHPPRLPKHPICYIERRYDPKRPFTGPFSGNYGANYINNHGYTPPSPPTSFGSVPEIVYPPPPVQNQNTNPSPPVPQPQPPQPYPPPVPVGPDGTLSPPQPPPMHVP